MTWGWRRNNRDPDEGKIIQGRIKSVWPDLPTRVLTRLEINLPDGADPIPWVASLSDEEFAAFRMAGKGALEALRRSVPRPDDPGRAERAILGRAEAYRLVEEAREQRERAEKAEDMLRARELEIGLVDAAVALALENLERGDELSALDQLRGILAKGGDDAR